MDCRGQERRAERREVAPRVVKGQAQARHQQRVVDRRACRWQGRRRFAGGVFEELLKLGRSLGDDVKVCPGKTIVPLYRQHVFAQIKPTTNSRVDFGFALTHYKGKLPKRLIDTGGLAKEDRITHRIELTATAQIDAEVKQWLKTAYDLDV